MVKFVLLGHRRSGSTLLLCDLAAHPNIYMFGEVFNENEEDRQHSFRLGLNNCRTAKRLGVSEARFYREDQPGGRFLRNFVYFRRYWSPVAVGFKLFYNQASDGPAKDAWDYLASNKRIRVIHLTRRNLLETFVSLQLAFQTNEWARPKGTAASRVARPEPLHLKPQEYENFFNRIITQRQWARDMFKAHLVLEIEYEQDVCRRFQLTMHKIQDFLEVPRREAQEMLEKQGRGDISERVSNYEELKNYFAKTQYAEMFI